MPFDEARVGGHGLTHTQLIEQDDFSVAARSLVDMSHLQETVVWLVNQVNFYFTAPRRPGPRPLPVAMRVLGLLRPLLSPSPDP